MSRGLPILAMLWLLPAAAQEKVQGLPVELPDLKRAVDFAQDVQPILKSACLACHNAKDASGDLILESIPQMLKGGETGPAVVPGKADDSLLLKTAAHRAKPFMPPPKNKIGAKPLTPRELGLLKLWIDQGAKGAATTAASIPPPQLRPMPGGWNPIYAVALDADGEFAACGRAGRLSIYHVPGRTLVDSPVDPKLSSLGPVAHADSVQSLAFSPDGTLLASGGYRSIKIWKRERPSRTLKIDGEVSLAAVSPDGARAAVVEKDIRLIDLSNGKATATLKTTASALAFSPDGALLLAAADKTLTAWKTADGAEGGKVELPAPATALAWAVDGKHVAAGFEDGVVRVWPWPPGDAKEIKAHTGKVTGIAAAGAGVLTAGADGKAKLWDGDKAVREASHGGPIVAVAATADGKRWLTVGGDKLAKLWDGENAKAIADLRTDGAARKSDRDTAAAVAFAGSEVKYREGRLKAAEDGKKKEEEEAKKAEEAVAPAEKTAKEREEAYAKAKAAQDEADKALKAIEGEAAAARSKAEGAADAIAQAATDAGLAKLEKAHGALLAPDEKEKKAVEEARARLAKADEALAKAKAAGTAAPDTGGLEKTLAEAQKVYDEAKAQLAAAKDDDAKKKAEALVQERRAKRNEAREKLAAAKAAPDKASLEKALTEAQKVYDAAKTQLAAAKDDDAKKKAEALVQERRAKRNEAREKLAAFEKGGAPSEAVAKAQAERDAAAKAVADAEKALGTDASSWEAKLLVYARAAAAARKDEKAKDGAEQAKKALEADAGELAKAAKAVEAKLADLQKKADEAKKAEASALSAAEQGRIGLESAKRRVVKAKESIAAAGKAIDDAKSELETQRKEHGRLEEARKKTQAAVGAAAAPLRGAAFTADGALAVVAAEDGRLVAFGAAKGEDGPTFDAHGTAIAALAVAANGTILTIARDGSVRGTAARPAWTLTRSIDATESSKPPVDRVTALAFSPDGTLLASGGGVPSRDGEVVLWKVADGTVAHAFKEPHSDAVYDLAFSPDGTLLASAAADKFAKVWDVASGKHVRSFEGHTHHVLGVSWNRTGRTLATSGGDNAVKVWNAQTGQQTKTIANFPKQVTALQHLGHESKFVVATGATQVRIVREDGGNEKNYDGASSFVYALAASGDGEVVAAGGMDGVLRVWRGQGGPPLAVFEK